MFNILCNILPVIASSGAGFKFEPINFIDNLSYMGTGMLCILIVIGAIILVTSLLNTVTSKIAAKKEKKN